MMGADEILIEQSLCINQRIRDSHCDICKEICPQKAIEINTENGSVQINAACTSCGLCLANCPAEVFTWENNVRYPVKIREGKLELFCTKTKCDGYAACLAQVNVYELAYLAFHAEVILCIDQAVCRQCNPKVFEHIYGMVERVNQFLVKLNLQPIVFSVQEKKIAEQINRRELFSFVFTKLKQSVAEVLPVEHKSVEYRRMLIAAIAQRFPEIRGVAAPLFWGAKSLGACNLCGTCVRACRQKALQIVRNEEKNYLILQQEQRLCIGCGACASLCPQKTLEISTENSSLESIAKNKPAILLERPMRYCESCGAAIIEAAQVLCENCRRKQNKKIQDIY